MNTRTSSFCSLGSCVAVTRVNGMMWVHRAGEPWYRGRWFDDAEWQAFTTGVAAGEFTVEAMAGDVR